MLALVVTGCQAPAAPAPAASPAPGPTPAAFRFSTAAIGPTALAGGAVVVDPGVLCPVTALRVVGAGLPPGRVEVGLAGGEPGGPIDVRPDGSFDLTLPLPAGGPAEVQVAHGTSRVQVPVPACSSAPAVPGLVVAASRVVQ